LWVLKPSPSPKPDPAMNEDWVKVAAAIREAFGHVPDVNSKDPIDVYMLMQKLERMKLNGPGDGGNTKLERKGAEGTDPEVTTIRQGKQATVGGKLLFDVGDAKLSPETTRMLDEIAHQIRGHRNIVLIKGHTSLDDFDDLASPEKKMDLSIRRAQTAADYLVSRGVEPDILRVQGCSTFEPVVQREYTPNAQALNRRVEVEATATLVVERQDSSPKGRGAPAPNPEPAHAPAQKHGAHH
ncbi:MAG: OmpA family protein, partial [Tepidisphaeraceae bacterium]